jgi:hypothetical protein
MSDPEVMRILDEKGAVQADYIASPTGPRNVEQYFNDTIILFKKNTVKQNMPEMEAFLEIRVLAYADS